MQLTKEETHAGHTITVITKKLRGINSPAKTTSHSIENRQPGFLGSGSRFVRDEPRFFGNQ